MPCQYHPDAPVAGICKCGRQFCSECANPFISSEGESYLCLDCAATFAKKKITQSYIAAGLGIVAGIFMISQYGQSMWYSPLMYAYIFWGTFFGWHFGIRFWAKFIKMSNSWPWWGNLLFFCFRFWAALLIGCFGGGIVQFSRCRNIAIRKLHINQLPESH